MSWILGMGLGLRCGRWVCMYVHACMYVHSWMTGPQNPVFIEFCHITARLRPRTALPVYSLAFKEPTAIPPPLPSAAPPDPTPHTTPTSIPNRYLDGSSQTFHPEALDVVEMLSDIHQHAHVLNAKMEDEGKTLDDR